MFEQEEFEQEETEGTEKEISMTALKERLHDTCS